MRLPNHLSAGFSMVELTVVSAVFIILAALALPSYNLMIQNSRIKTATDSIYNGVQVARAAAVSRNESIQFDLRGTNSAWTVCVKPASGACPNPDNASTIQSRSLGDGSSADISVVPSVAGPYVFNGLGQLTPAPITFDVDNTSISASESRNLRVLVGAGGSVKTCDPGLSPTGTDPRRCT
jgi:type IV fimbrial biogenesis protein FimT